MSSGAGSTNTNSSSAHASASGGSLTDRFAGSKPLSLSGDAHALATAGLHTLDAFRAAREEADRKVAGGGAAAAAAAAVRASNVGAGAGTKRKNGRLSFAHEEEEDDEVGAGGGVKVQRIAKDPSVSTDFLPDAGRAAREAAVRSGLVSEWDAAQAVSKAETLRVVYSYWDGSGHRRETDVPKGSTIGAFLEAVRRSLCKEFSELKSSDSLIFVKEDLILPHSLTFYDLITTSARGKSGPLFDFDVRHDVRLIGDARVERDDSHPGKVLDRRWYEKNKHIFPFSR